MARLQHDVGVEMVMALMDMGRAWVMQRRVGRRARSVMLRVLWLRVAMVVVHVVVVCVHVTLAMAMAMDEELLYSQTSHAHACDAIRHDMRHDGVHM